MRQILGAGIVLLALGAFSGAWALWQPPLSARWQYQLQARRGHDDTGGIDVDICVRPSRGAPCVSPEVFDIDLYVDDLVSGNNSTVNTAGVQAIHAKGAHAICYMTAGDVENFRPDYQQFVDFDAACNHCLIGKPFSRVFPNEYWSNINNDQGQRDFILQMVEARVAKCAQAGFDGVEFDVVDAWAQGTDVTGWTIDYATQITFNRALADLAHAYGLSVALKNDLDQIADLVPYFDYAVNEQCFQYDECGNLSAFTDAGKAVFQVEYRIPVRRFCSSANQLNFNSIKKSPRFSLFATPYKVCR